MDPYVIGVDGTMRMDPLPPFDLQPFCEGFDASAVTYSAQMVNGRPLPSSVWFYPDTRVFEHKTFDMSDEGLLNLQMIGSINYYIVPMDCPL